MLPNTPIASGIPAGELHLPDQTSNKMSSFHVVMSANQAWNIYNFRLGLVSSLIAAGVRVTILAPLDSSSAKLKALGCDIIDVPMASQGINPVVDGLLIASYVRLLHRLKPDLSINYTIKPNIYGSIAARLAGVPSLAIVTGLGYTFINDNIVARMARKLFAVALRYPAQVWFLNADDQRVFLQKNLVDPNKTRVLDGEGVDTSYFSPTVEARKDSGFRFLLVARMLWDKGIAEYVEAAQIVKRVYPNARFQLLGATGVDNPSAASSDQVKAWHDAGIVEYLGTSTDVRGVISNADCVVLPSYREGVPRTLMEAAAMAKPLIATDVPGCREVVRDGKNGFLCKVRDGEDLSRKMIDMLELPSVQRAALGAASRTYVKSRFDEKLVIAKYFDFLAGGHAAVKFIRAAPVDQTGLETSAS